MHLPDYREARSRSKKKYNRIDFKIDDNIEKKYSGKKYFLKTYGCQMNEHDSENLSAMLEAMGFVKVDDYNDADLVL